MEIEFDGAYDRDDFEKGLALLERRSLARRITQWLLALLLVVSLGLGLYEWTQGRGEDALSKLARPAFLAILLGYYYLAPRLRRRAVVNKLFAEKPVRKMVGKADTEGILLTPAGGGSARFLWEKFIRTGRRDPLLSLLMVDGTMALFKQNFFQSEADWSRFLKMVEQRVIVPK